MQAGPKARVLERRAHRVIYVGTNLWSHLVQMLCFKSAPFPKLDQVAQVEYLLLLSTEQFQNRKCCRDLFELERFSPAISNVMEESTTP